MCLKQVHVGAFHVPQNIQLGSLPEPLNVLSMLTTLCNKLLLMDDNVMIKVLPKLTIGTPIVRPNTRIALNMLETKWHKCGSVTSLNLEQANFACAIIPTFIEKTLDQTKNQRTLDSSAIVEEKKKLQKIITRFKIFNVKTPYKGRNLQFYLNLMRD